MKLHRNLSLFAGLFLLVVPSNFAAIIYVTPSGAGAMNGTSWTNAYPGTSLQIAINSANFGDEVWVANGTYLTTTGSDRTIAFSMKTGVEIYGSFVGNETNLSQRIISCGPNSILSGAIGTGSNTDNSYQVMRNTTIDDTTAMLDGFVITGGYDERSPTLTEGLGGGVLNIGSNGGHCLLTLRNCVVTGNQSEFGAGIFNDAYNGGQVYLVLENCIITNNHATGGGGGIDNFALQNGNIFCYITNTVISDNTADDAAGAIYCWGGLNGSAMAYLGNCTVVNNHVTSGVGGGFVIDQSNSGAGAGGGSGTARVDLRASIVWGNTAGTSPQFHIYQSGVAHADNSDVDITNQSGVHTLDSLSTNNINQDPLFLNENSPKGADSCWMTTDDGYQLSSSSPGLDYSLDLYSGKDLAFHTRLIGLQTELGAYELITNTTSVVGAKDLKLNIYPNPFISNIFITTEASISGSLINYCGKELRTISLSPGENNIDLSQLSSGIYFIYFPTTSIAYKVIKQ